MQFGVIFPQEIGSDTGAVRAFAQAAEDLGYDYLHVYDHVLGADVSVRPDWKPRKRIGEDRPFYTHKAMFHECFVTLGFLAAITRRIRLITGVLVLPQRQTALAAKQAAEVDVLSGGRLTLGIGLGWNDVEFEALGQSYQNRGVRCEEQVDLLRALWTRDTVTFDGKWHRVTAAGINPLPVQQPIPIWFGGAADPALRRIARIADGFVQTAYHRPVPGAQEMIERLRRYAAEAGRDAAAIAIDVRANLTAEGVEQAVEDTEKWTAMGVTHVTFNHLNDGYKTVDQHIENIRRFKSALPDGENVGGDGAT